jgi:TIR domain
MLAIHNVEEDAKGHHTYSIHLLEIFFHLLVGREMKARVELVKGDMFEGPSDLMVIPCSTVPTITWFVAEHLRSFGIPEPRNQMSPGDVEFVDLGRASNIAQVAAMAASVIPPGKSSLQIIERIGNKLGSYAADNSWIGQISCPLLGTGAGNLEATQAARALVTGYFSTAPERAILRIFVLEDRVFERIRDVLVRELDREFPEDIDSVAAADRPVRVFISYTNSSAQHQNWVKTVGTYLRSTGIDARLDIWHLRRGMDVAQWMCNELDMADRVLLICDELYAQKADGRHGGVGWEIRVIQGDLLQSQQTNPDKFVPIIVTEDAADGMPSFIKSVYCLNWPPSQRDDPSLFEELVRVIYRAQEEAPPLGQRPAYAVVKR